MTYPSPDLRIPADRDDQGIMTITWLEVSVCSRHGRPATRQDPAFFMGSVTRRAGWHLANSYAFYVPSIRQEWQRRLLGIRAVWPKCDVCLHEARRPMLALATSAAVCIVSFIACLVLDSDNAGRIAAVVLVVFVLVFIVLASWVVRRGHEIAEATPDLSAVIVHSPHPVYYEEASRAIRMHGYRMR